MPYHFPVFAVSGARNLLCAVLVYSLVQIGRSCGWCPYRRVPFISVRPITVSVCFKSAGQTDQKLADWNWKKKMLVRYHASGYRAFVYHSTKHGQHNPLTFASVRGRTRDESSSLLQSLGKKKIGICTGWKEKLVRGYHRWILYFRFDGNTCKESAKLILILNFKIKIFFFFLLYSTRHKSKTFPRNHKSRSNNSPAKIS